MRAKVSTERLARARATFQRAFLQDDLVLLRAEV